MVVPLSITLAIVFWASAFPGIRVGLADYSPFHLALFRFLIASALFIVIAYFKKIPIPKKEDWPRIMIVGFFGITIYNIGLNWGEVYVTSASASFIINMVPLITAILSIALLGESFSKASWTGTFVCFLGVTFIALGESHAFQFNKGLLLVLCAAFAQSLYFILQKPLLIKYGSLPVVSYAMWTGTLPLLLFTPGLFDSISMASTHSTLTVIYLGIFPAACAFLCWSVALKHLTAAHCSTYMYFLPLGSVIIAYFWLNELPSFTALIGGGIVVLGLLIAKFPFRRSSFLKS